MQVNPVSAKGYKLLHDGVVELARVEANGMRVDLQHLRTARKYCQEEIRRIRAELTSSDVWKKWKRVYGPNSNLTSDDQLAHIFFDVLGYQPSSYTARGKPSTTAESLSSIDHPFIAQYARLAKLDKAEGTYLKGIERETMGDRIHPVFNLHTAATYRSSSDTPNFQNFPVRDEWIAELIRRCFIPSPGCVITENDFKGVEVSVSACYHKDENFISYITTPGKDMHRDMAAQLYMMEPEQVSKKARYGAKNKFVFPQFYGDFYVSCAKALWEWAIKGELEGPNGESMLDWLKSNGISTLGTCDPSEKPIQGTFEYHVMQVENDFWNNRFGGYGQWRKEWYSAYQREGYFDLLSGFRISGDMRRNAVVNYPVQGSAFHCLLWSLCRVNKLLRKYKMKSMIVGQIHDSMVGDVRIDELKDYMEIVEQVTTVDVLKAFRWLIIPLEIEYEICPPGGNWFEKQEIHFEKGFFYNPDRTKRTTNAEKFLRTLKRK